MPLLAFRNGNSEADARLLAEEGLRCPDKANPTKVARAYRASAQTMEAGHVASSRMCCALHPKCAGADALGKSQRQASTCSGKTSTMDCGQLDETGWPSGCRAVSEATSGEQSTTVSSARKCAALLKLPSRAAWSTERMHCGERPKSEKLAGFV
jgi:hypothetical protein